MSFSGAALLALASQCASSVAPQTVVAIVKTESHGFPFALNVNGGSQPPAQNNAADAAATAQRYILAGYSVDLGLGQINSRNMRRLSLTWRTVFDPCTNIAALGKILTENYTAVEEGRHPQTALRLAISLYNTGSTSRGFRNGYVAKVVGNAGVLDDETANFLASASSPASSDDVRVAVISENATPPEQRAIRQAPPPAWNLFERAAYERRLLNRSASEQGTILWSN